MAKHAGGRPKKLISPTQLQKVQLAAQAGFTLEQTAKYIGIDRGTLRRHPEIFAAMEAAERDTTLDAVETGLQIMHNRKAPGPAASMVRFWLVHRGGPTWRDKVTLAGSVDEPLKVEGSGFELTADKLAEAMQVYARAQRKKPD